MNISRLIPRKQVAATTSNSCNPIDVEKITMVYDESILMLLPCSERSDATISTAATSSSFDEDEDNEDSSFANDCDSVVEEDIHDSLHNLLKLNQRMQQQQDHEQQQQPVTTTRGGKGSTKKTNVRKLLLQHVQCYHRHQQRQREIKRGQTKQRNLLGLRRIRKRIRCKSATVVTFAESDTIQEMEQQQQVVAVDIQDLWYTDEEYESMKVNAMKSIKTRRTNNKSMSPPILTERKEHKTQIRHLVYDEQEDQRVRKGRIYDPSAIRDIYRTACSDLIQRAIDTAHQDELVATRIYNNE